MSSDIDWDALASSSAGGSARTQPSGTGGGAADSAPASPFAALAADEWADVEAYTRNLDLPMVK
jgi:hypothetical protein